MAYKDLKKVEQSIFIVTVVLILVVGASVLAIISNNDDDRVKVADVGDTKSVTGVITRLYEDCVRGETFVSGKVFTDDYITCDGGSSITVGGVRIQTSAGFVAENAYFETDISQLSAGDTVEVRYNERSPGIYDVNCDECQIRPL